MSGIMGVWNVGGEPVSRELLLRMNDRMSHRGPDGSSHLLCGSAAFAFQQLKVTPESSHEKQPLQSPGGIIALLDGRLDNREELIQQIRPQRQVDPTSPDVNLLLAAYEIFSEDFASRLEGDFAAAVFDPARKQLLLARDAMGARALYYCRTGASVLFASEIKTLLAHPAVETRLNEASLAEFIFSTSDHRDETNTLFSGILRVPSANRVSVTPERTSVDRYFDFDTTTELRLRNQAEYVEAYREGFSKAVRRRLRSSYPTAVAVSGGLDSSSIFSVAHGLRQADPIGTPPLLPIGLIVESNPGAETDAGEWEFQKAVQDHCAAEMIRIPIKTFAAGHDSAKKIWHAEGLWMIEDGYEELYRQSTKRGARVFLSGIFGDNLVMSPQFLLDLALAGKWPSAWQAYRGFMSKPWLLWEDGAPDPAKLHALLLRELRSFLVPEFFRPFYRKVRYQWLRRKPHDHFFSPRFLEVAAAVAASSSAVRCRPGRAHSKALYLSARSKVLTSRIEMEAKAVGMFPLDLAYPYRDKELVQLVMSIPGEAVYPGGDSRGIHREAMKGILPEGVRLRRTKADFTKVARLGVLQDADGLPALKTGAAMRLGLLKPVAELGPELNALLRALEQSDDHSKDLSDTAMNLLTLEHFLLVFFGQ